MTRPIRPIAIMNIAVVSSRIVTHSPNAFQLIGRNNATPTGTAGWIHFTAFFIANILAIIPAIPNEITIVITAQAILPIAPLWSPKPRLILSDSTHSKSKTAAIKNISSEITGTIHDNSSL